MAKNNPATPLTWKIREQGGTTTVDLIGEVDEDARLPDLRPLLEGKVIFKLDGIRRLNSCGVREWVGFFRDLPAVSEMSLTHCSPAVVTQLNMIYKFNGPATVQSFMAPYICDSCNREELKLLDVDTHFPGGDIDEAPEFPCGKCGKPMDLDDMPGRYFSFLTTR